jgi:curved DNA-binding protein
MHRTRRDHYRILGVHPTASPQEIRDAFRRLARTHHPDLNPHDRRAEARFKEINEAHEILSDPDKRRRYDEGGGRGQVDPGRRWPAGRSRTAPLGRSEAAFERRFSLMDPDDLFGFWSTGSVGDLLDAVFGAHRPRARGGPQPRRGQDVETEIALSLEEAARGTTSTLEITGCFGRRHVHVCIPAGITDGARVRAAGRGTEGTAGGAAGDLLFRVRIAPHAVFRRDGDSLQVRVAVPEDVARVGGAVEVPTLNGTPARLHVPPGTEDGAQLRLPGLGMPRLGRGGCGDLTAEVEVRPLRGP